MIQDIIVKEMKVNTKVNKRYNIYIYKVEQRKKIAFQSLNCIKYYLYHYISSIFYSNLYYLV